jgi:dihydroxy-acid dehydratase
MPACCRLGEIAGGTMQKHNQNAREKLRSHRWHGAGGEPAAGERSRLAQLGFGREDYLGKPVVAILNPWSELNAAAGHLRARAEDVKRGVWQAGGFPVELPVMSLAESAVKSTTMLYRNFLAIEAEELLRFHPIDGAVLLGGCAKTTAGLLMGGISANLPIILLPAGPMLGGSHAVSGEGAAHPYVAERAFHETPEAIEEGFARTPGTSLAMESASTMPLVAEALGLTLAGASSIPALDAAHHRVAAESGRRIVDMIWDDVKPRDILTRRSFENALVAFGAVGGSISTVIHILALARRANVPLSLRDVDRFARRVPVIADLKPGGRGLMDDFHRAGGSRAFLHRLAPLLHGGERTVCGGTVALRNAGADVLDNGVIRPLEDPVADWSRVAVLSGNLAPEGCLMRPDVLEPRLLRHTGAALVFDDEQAMLKAMSDPTLDVTPDHVLVLRYAGPFGATGMPELAAFPIPEKLAKAGVKDMLRITDGRMSGRSAGACMLHVSPEAYLGGPLAALRNGDLISVDVEERSIRLLVSEDEIGRRLDRWSPPQRRVMRGSLRLFASHIRQAHEGCDFDFFEAEEEFPEKEAF